MVCNATKSTSVPVRVVAYECIAKIATLYYDKLMQYMQTLFELSLNTIRADEEAVGMMAIEFWSSVCDEEMEILDEVTPLPPLPRWKKKTERTPRPETASGYRAPYSAGGPCEGRGRQSS